MNQYMISIGLITVTAITSYFTIGLFEYKVVALILLLMVSLLAMLFDIFPVLVAAIISALVWNFFFIPPKFTFHVGSPEDALMFSMYFVIAMINTVLTSRIRRFEKKVRDKDEREKTITLYNALLNSLSHELRTPISTIIGAVDTIKENNSKLSDHNKSELHNEIEIASFRLNRQVENLLNMSRLEAGVLQPKKDWCDVNEMIYSVIKNNKENVVSHQVIFNGNENLPLFKMDRGLTEQILNNILHNALMYTPENSVITIQVAQGENTCRFEISDNGYGVPKERIHSIFDKFYRLPETAVGGTGLGLAIARGFAEAMDGTVSLENLKTGGAHFIVEFPSETSLIHSEIENEQS
ncbi:MAG: ATP-binding protein [Marinoscillum sp.]